MMNSDNEVLELSKEVYVLLCNGRFNMTVELLDGTKVSGRVIKHCTLSAPLRVTILLFTDENEEKEIDLKIVKSVTETLTKG
jgi:hypothetical protein